MWGHHEGGESGAPPLNAAVWPLEPAARHLSPALRAARRRGYLFQSPAGAVPSPFPPGCTLRLPPSSVAGRWRSGAAAAAVEAHGGLISTTRRRRASSRLPRCANLNVAAPPPLSGPPTAPSFAAWHMPSSHAGRLAANQACGTRACTLDSCSTTLRCTASCAAAAVCGRDFAVETAQTDREALQGSILHAHESGRPFIHQTSNT